MISDSVTMTACQWMTTNYASTENSMKTNTRTTLNLTSEFRRLTDRLWSRAVTSYNMFLYNFAQNSTKKLTRIYLDRLRRNITSKYTDRSIFSPCTNSKNVYRCKVETWALDNGYLLKNQKYHESSIRYLSYLLRSVFCKTHRSNKKISSNAWRNIFKRHT